MRPKAYCIFRHSAHSLARMNYLNEQITSSHLTKLGLSCRESEVLIWVMQGKTNEEIGVVLKISPRTVKKHLERVYRKLGVKTRMAAVFTAAESLKSTNGASISTAAR